MSGIADKVIVLTGASSGIGEATATLLAERGAKLVLGARRGNLLETLTNRITSAGGSAVYLTTDVARREQVAALVKLATDRFGRLDVLVSNAGIAPISTFDTLDVEAWDAMIDINFRGVLHGIAAALPIFRARGGGHFVNVISTAGIQIVPQMGVYAATKNAVRTVSEALRQEAGPTIRVTEVSPGYVRTNLADSMRPEMRAKITQGMTSFGIAPEAIGRAIAFAIEQPADVDVGSIVVRPTAQS